MKGICECCVRIYMFSFYDKILPEARSIQSKPSIHTCTTYKMLVATFTVLVALLFKLGKLFIAGKSQIKFMFRHSLSQSFLTIKGFQIRNKE